MGMKEEIEALPRHSWAPQAKMMAVTAHGPWLHIDDVLRIIEKHAAPVADMTPGMQPRPFAGLAAVSSKTLPADAAAIPVLHADELYVTGDGEQPRKDIGCHSGTDGDCYWTECPQIRDGEPHKSGRNCPLWDSADDS